MGCFNVVCAISQLPICWNDEVVFLTLVENSSWRSRFNGTSVSEHYLVRSLPIYAKYDDYGAIEDWDPDDIAVKWFLKQFPYKMEKHEEHEEDNGPMSMEKAMDWMHRGTAFVPALFSPGKYDKRTNAAVNKIFVRKDVWDFLLGFEWKHWRTKRKINLEAFKADARAYIEWFDRKLEETSKIEDENERGMKRFQLLFEKDTDLQGNTFLEAFEYDHCNKMPQALGYYQTMVNKQLMSPESIEEKLPKEEVVAICEKIAEIFFIEAVMHSLKKNWHLLGGNGSQEADFEMAKTFHEKMAKIATKQMIEDE